MTTLDIRLLTIGFILGILVNWLMSVWIDKDTAFCICVFLVCVVSFIADFYRK